MFVILLINKAGFGTTDLGAKKVSISSAKVALIVFNSVDCHHHLGFINQALLWFLSSPFRDTFFGWPLIFRVFATARAALGVRSPLMWPPGQPTNLGSFWAPLADPNLGPRRFGMKNAQDYVVSISCCVMPDNKKEVFFSSVLSILCKARSVQTPMAAFGLLLDRPNEGF